MPSEASASGELTLWPVSSRAFDTFPDFAKHNHARHNTTRSDTFNTPRNLPKQQAGPPGALGPREYWDMCELSLAKKHQLLLRDLKAEVHEALDPLKEELSGTLADARGVVALEEILRLLADLKAPPVDLAPITSAIESATLAQQEAVGRLEGQLVQDMARLQSELHASRQQQEAAEGSVMQRVAELQDVVLRSESQVSKLLGLQESMSQAAARTADEVQQLQQLSTQHLAGLGASLEKHISNFQHQPMNVSFDEVCQHVSQQTAEVQEDLLCLLGEIGKVQQALNVDFAAALHVKFTEICNTMSSVPADKSGVEAGSRGKLASKAEKRVRDSCAQTKRVDVVEALCQTDVQVADQPMVKRKSSATKKKEASGPNGEASKGFRKMQTKPVFADADAMKQKARVALTKPQSRVFGSYHDIGCIQAIAKSSVFEFLTLFVIVANAIWIAVDTDLNNATVLIEAPIIFQVIENAFCAYFTIEIIIRFLAYREKRLCLSDAWFVFDSVLVLMMIVETWIFGGILPALLGSTSGADLGAGSILRIMKIVKMLRISRVARLLRSMPELLVLLKGVRAASRSVLVFVGLWLVIIYIYALLFRHLAKDASMTSDTRYFRSVPEAMNTLLLEGILPDYAATVNDMANENFLFYPLMLTFIVLAVLTLMNMLVGVLVEIVGAVAISEKEGMAALYLATELRGWMESNGYKADRPISKRQYQKLLTEPQVTRIVGDVGVDVHVLLDMTDTIFEDLRRSGSPGLTFEDFAGLLLDMRGNNLAKVKDIKEQFRLIKFAMGESMGNAMEKVNADIGNLHRELRALRAAIRADGAEVDEEEEEEEDIGNEGTEVDIIEILSHSTQEDPQLRLIDVGSGDGGASSHAEL